MSVCIVCAASNAHLAGICQACLALPKHDVYAVTQQGLNAACHKPAPVRRTYTKWKPVQTFYVPTHGGQVCILWCCGVIEDPADASPQQESWTQRWLCECGCIVPGHRAVCDCGRSNPARDRHQ